MSPTILIIDDFASVRLYHIGFLSRKGYRCLGAASGTEALALLDREPVDLILLDLVMPGMSGGDFVRRLDGAPRLAPLPVIIITSEQPLAEAALGSGRRPAEVLVKPVMPEALLNCVRSLLPESATTRTKS